MITPPFNIWARPALTRKLLEATDPLVVPFPDAMMVEKIKKTFLTLLYVSLKDERRFSIEVNKKSNSNESRFFLLCVCFFFFFFFRRPTGCSLLIG